MKIQPLIVYLLMILLAAPSAMGKQRREPPEVWRAFAERLEAGAFVRVRLIDHRQVKGQFIMMNGDILRIKPKTRVPVPIRDIQLADIESIDRQREGWSPGAKVLTAVGVGAGGLLVIVAAILATWD